MRFIAASLAMVLLGCTKEPISGWKYDQGPYAVPLRYEFKDPGHTVFIGVCKPKRDFMIIGGDWHGRQFTLTVDDRSWTLPTEQGVEHHALPVRLEAAGEAIANAKQRIVFQVGDWTREINPGPPLTTFVADCRKGRLG